MQAVILAAGKGSRLHPITVKRSKAMLPILGKPIVERVMESIASSGVRDFILVVSPDDRDITRYFQRECQLDVDVRCTYQAERTGMAHALLQAAPLIREDFFLSACDNLVSAEDVQRMRMLWETEPRPNGLLSLLRVSLDEVHKRGIVDWDGAWIKRIVEKPQPDEAPSDIGSMPLYMFQPRILEYLPQIPLSSRGEYELQDAIQMLIERDGYVRGLPINRRMTLTTASDLLEINRHYMTMGDGQPQLAPRRVGTNTHLITPLHIEHEVIIGAGCTIGPNVYIERGSQIGDGVRLQDAIVLREAVILAGSQVNSQVVS